MWRRAILWGGTSLALVSSGLSLRNNDYDVNQLGVVRLGRSVATIVDVIGLYKRGLYYRNWDKLSPEYLTQRSHIHKLAAERLLELMCINKGVYIKLGQHIGSLDYLLPKEFVETMKVLHSNAPQNPIEDVLNVVRQEMQCEPEEIFVAFDPRPLGTASLAQVHKAVLKTGEVVAVKVQHPYVQGNTMLDLKTMDILARLMTYIFPDMKIQWLIDESKKNLPQELDFLHEGENAEKIGMQFERYAWLKVPKIYWQYSSPRMLVMEFLEGGQVTDIDYIKTHDINPFVVAHKIGKLYAEMIFSNGFVHSDPHPGNILVRKNTQNQVEIVLLDHGLYAKLTDKFRYEYSKLWLSIFNVDTEGIRIHSENLGVRGNGLYGLLACMVTGRPWKTLMKGISNTEYSPEERTHIQQNIEYNYINYVLQQVDRQMLLIFKTNDLIRGIEHTLQTQNRMTAFWIMSKSCVHSKFAELKSLSSTRWEQTHLFLREHWEIFKLNIYYLYLGIKFNGFREAMRQIAVVG